MSMLMQLISVVANAERQIDSQVMRLEGYKNEINRILQRVNAAFYGSSNQHGQSIINQLTLTEKQISDTISRLQNAKEKLIQIRMV